jgi:hypothetical protein
VMQGGWCCCLCCRPLRNVVGVEIRRHGRKKMKKKMDLIDKDDANLSLLTIIR